MRCLLVSRHEDFPVFDAAFDLFWRDRSHPLAEPGFPSEQLARSLQGSRAGAAGIERGEAGGDASGTDGTVPLYSAAEALRRRDFATLSEAEIAAAKRAMAEMRWDIATRRARRRRPSRRGSGLDMRRTLRQSLRYGGELVELSRRGPKRKRRRLVLICDISGSMDLYTQLLLHFLHSLERSFRQTEVFVFGTRLTRLTRALRRRDPNVAIAEASRQVEDWAGGTRIGESLSAFNRQWARRVLGHGDIVVIISDGWDRGEPGVLEREMARLRRGSYRLLWLNPLLGARGYRPLTRGMQAALPYIDDFLPVHNLDSLADLARVLDRLQEGGRS
ncbi:MAG: vWA domain-containing protein [Chloroflexota bacterium]